MTLTVDEILTCSIDLLGATKGNLQLYDKQQDCLRIAANVGFQPEFLDHFREVRKGPSCVCAAALDHGSRLIVENVYQDRNFPALGPLFAAEGLTAVQSTPIFDPSGSLFGMVSTHFEHAHRPTEREFRILDMYVDLAANLMTAGIPGALAIASAMKAEGHLEAHQYAHPGFRLPTVRRAAHHHHRQPVSQSRNAGCRRVRSPLRLLLVRQATRRPRQKSHRPALGHP
jgi:hypothetical protein